MSQCCLSFLERSRGHSPTEGTLPVRLPSLQSRRHVRLQAHSTVAVGTERTPGQTRSSCGSIFLMSPGWACVTISLREASSPFPSPKHGCEKGTRLGLRSWEGVHSCIWHLEVDSEDLLNTLEPRWEAGRHQIRP